MKAICLGNMELFEELEQLKSDLNKSVRTLRISGGEYAKAECDYRIVLAKKELELKSQGYSATLTYDLARGDERVANLKQNEINKEVIYRANLEAINSIKLQMKLIENQIAREYANVNNEI